MKINAKQRRRTANRISIKIVWSYIRLYLVKRLFHSKTYQKKLEKLHQKNAEIAKKTILELDGLFIKVGQLLSIMSGFLPKAYGEVLESLQDHTPASEYEHTKKTIEEELGESVDGLFQSFEKLPVASASIGQVHQAVLKTGEKVAVKIQHPQIEILAELDLSIIEGLIKRVLRFFKITGLDHVYVQVRQMIQEELDYEKESESIQQIKENCKDIEGVIIPKVFTEYSSKKVLVTTFYEGTKITNTSQLEEWGIQMDKVMERLVFCYCEMILNHGIYHADPHPGNILINKNGEVVILDYGAVGRLEDSMREQIPVFIQAVLYKDNEKVLKSMKKMGFIGKGKAAEETAEKIIEALSNFISEGIDVQNLSFDSIKNSGIDKLRKELSIKELTNTVEVPKDWILLERTLLLLYGINTRIAPEYNPVDTIKPYLKRLIFKDGGFRKVILNAIKHQANLLLGLPKKTDEFLTKANKGDLKIKLKDYNRNTGRLYAVGQQIFMSLIAFMSLCMAVYCHQNNLSGYENVFIGISIVFGLLMLRLMWKNRAKD